MMNRQCAAILGVLILIVLLPRATLAARGETPAAFGRRCIPPPPQRGCRVGGPGAGCVAPPSNTPGIAPHRAQHARWGPRSAVVAPLRRGPHGADCAPWGGTASRLARLGATPRFHHGLLGSRGLRASRHISGAVAVFMLLAVHSTAQTPRPALTRLAVLQAEDRRAPAARDLAVIRAATHSDDPQTARIAVRALGRLERPSLVADILPSLKHPLPEIRAEAATALGQSLEDTKSRAASPTIANTVIDALITRLSVEAEASVRGAIFETLGRTAATAIHAERVEAVLVDAAARESTNDGRLGIASGFEALVRLRRREHAPQAAAITAMRSMVSVSPPVARRPFDPSRDVRVRRLALEALVTAEAVDDATLGRALRDADPQVRRLAMRAAAAGSPAAAGALTAGLTDPSSMVRIEALRAMQSSRAAALCSAAVTAVADRDPQVALVALDQLAACGASPDA